MFVLINIYVILTIIRPQDYTPALTAIPILPVVLITAFIGWVISRNKNLSEPQYPLLVMFLAVTMISEIVNGWTGGSLDQLATFGPAVIAFVLLANATSTRKRVIFSMMVFTLCAAVLALHGVMQAETGTGWTGMGIGEDGRIQYVGIFNDPNDLGLLFVTVLPMSFYLSSRGGWLGLRRLFWLGVAGLLLYAAYLTVSRGAVLAVAAIGVVYIWRTRGLFIATLCGAAGMTGIMMLPSRLGEIDAGEDSAAGRIDAWYEGLQMFFSHPLLGVGAGNFTDYNDLTAHNSFVLVLAETGIAGYVLWLAFVGYCFWMMNTAAGYADNETGADLEWREWRPIFPTLFLSLIGFFTAAFFLSRSYVIILYLLAGLVVGCYTTARKQFPFFRDFSLGNDLVRWPVISVGSICVLYVVVKVLL